MIPGYCASVCAQIGLCALNVNLIRLILTFL